MPFAVRTGRIFDNQTIIGDVASVAIDTKGQDSFGLTYKWTGTLSGTLKLQACNDTDQNAAGDGVGWVDIANLTTSPGGSPGADQQEFTTKYHRYYRVFFTHAADGVLTMVVNADNGPGEV
jgi:hypothetical protein